MIFVTGGTGILGSYLLLQLTQTNKSIRALKRTNSNILPVLQLFKLYKENAEELFHQIEWVEGELYDIEFIEKSLDGITEIYHCAAQVSYDERERNTIFNTNIEYTKNLLNIALEKKNIVFCHVSSIAVLDVENEWGIINETSKWNKDLPHSSYAESKYLSEMEVWRASQEGLNVIIVNPGIILGSTHFSQSSGSLFSLHYSKNSFYTSGNAGLVDARDVAFCMIQLMNKKIYNERFILISESKTYKEITNFLRKKYNLKPAKFLSNSILKIGVYVAVLLKRIIPKLNELNWATYKAITTTSKLSNKKSMEKLQFEYIPVIKSLNEHAENYLKSISKIHKM